jgi:hypothetical protein
VKEVKVYLLVLITHNSALMYVILVNLGIVIKSHAKIHVQEINNHILVLITHSSVLLRAQVHGFVALPANRATVKRPMMDVQEVKVYLLVMMAISSVVVNVLPVVHGFVMITLYLVHVVATIMDVQEESLVVHVVLETHGIVRIKHV